MLKEKEAVLKIVPTHLAVLTAVVVQVTFLAGTKHLALVSLNLMYLIFFYSTKVILRAKRP